MSLSPDNEIRDKLGSYLLGEVSLEDFKDWFVPFSWNVEHNNNQTATNMVYEIELRLAEYSNNYWNENELKNLLSPIAESYNININFVPDIEMNSNAWVDRWSISVFSHILSSAVSL
jgi:hypothetical protein